MATVHKGYPNIVGSSVPKFGSVIDGNFRSIERNIVRQVWNTNCYGNKTTPNKGPQIGGFRRVMNAGDYLSRVNYACGGSNQITKRSGSLVFTTKDGVRRCNETIPVANTNVKYVYDSSDFIRYRREKSINKGYAGGRTDCNIWPRNILDVYCSSMTVGNSKWSSFVSPEEAKQNGFTSPEEAYELALEAERKGTSGGDFHCSNNPTNDSIGGPLMTDYSYGGSGVPLGRGRQMFVNGMNSYGH